MSKGTKTSAFGLGARFTAPCLLIHLFIAENKEPWIQEMMDDFRIFLEFEKEVTCNLIITYRSLFHERTYETIKSGRRLIL